MMGAPNGSEMAKSLTGTPSKSRAVGPNSPALPSDFDDEVPMSPVAFSTGAASTDFGSTPTKSYAAFPRTPQQQQEAVLDAPSSRLRHSINMKKALSVQVREESQAENNLSFDMGEVDMLTSADNLNQLPQTPFSKTGQANYVTLKEQEKVGFDLIGQYLLILIIVL